MIFYQEPEPPKRPTGDGTELRDLLPPPDFEIVRGIVETGGAYAQIARNLNIAPQSLKNRVSAILSKTGCSSRLELATRYCRENLAEVRAAAGMQSGV